MDKKSKAPKEASGFRLQASGSRETRSPKSEVRSLLVMAGITLYCLLFLMVHFGPLDQQLQRMSPPGHFFRIDFFTQMLDPGFWHFAWFGEDFTFSFFAAMKIITVAGIVAIGAAGIGYFPLQRLQASDFRLQDEKPTKSNLEVRSLKSEAFCLTRCECFVFGSAIGLSVISTLMLLIGLCGDLTTLTTRINLFSVIVSGVVISLLATHSSPLFPRHYLITYPSPLATKLLLLLAVPSLLILLFGGILPPVEYDVTSYHIPGAKLFYETGRIGFVPNNVYTNMPFAAEMFYVCGMVLTGDWYIGSLIGKLLIAYCTVLTGLGIYAFGTRLHSSTAGMIGFLLYVSLPWVSWVSTAGLIDCVFGMYLLLAIFALYFATDGTELHGKFLYLSGYLAGCSAACKYTAVPFLVLPLCVFALIFVCKQPDKMQFYCDKRAVRTLCFFALSIVLACGLWYGKNLVATGNPTYPLMYNLFGDRTGTWDAAKNARWQAAHSSTDFSASQLTRDAKTVLFGSDWLAPVLIPLAVLPFLRRRQNRVLVALALYLIFYLTLWWLLTHRLERFWVPLLPIVALLAGIGANRLQASGFRLQGYVVFSRSMKSEGRSPTTVFVALLLILNTCYTFFPNAVSVPGKYSRFGFGVEAARLDAMRVASPLILHFNANPPTGKLLLVGDAEVFDYNVPVLYNTCFDDTAFDLLVFDKDNANQMRSPEAIRKRLKEADVSYIIVNWAELSRFRSPGNYGYTSELVQPEVFERLVRLGILQRVSNIPSLPGQVIYEVVEL